MSTRARRALHAFDRHVEWRNLVYLVGVVLMAATGSLLACAVWVVGAPVAYILGIHDARPVPPVRAPENTP